MDFRISTRHFLVCNRVRIWRTGRHTPTRNSRENPPPPGEPTENHMPVSLLCAVCKVLERLNTIRSNNSNAHSNMAFYEIAPALHSCYLFLILLVKTKTKIFNQMLSHLHFAKTSIPLITQFFSKNTNDMVRRRGSRIILTNFLNRCWEARGMLLREFFRILTFLGFWVIQTGYWAVPFLLG